MEELNFNIYGFARPSTAAERTELLIEALRVADDLLEMIDARSARLQAQDRALEA